VRKQRVREGVEEDTFRGGFGQQAPIVKLQ